MTTFVLYSIAYLVACTLVLCILSANGDSYE